MSHLNDSQINVTVVGGPDVDRRMDLMGRLRFQFRMSALGSDPSLASVFAREGFRYRHYHMRRRMSPVSDLRTFVQLWSIFRQEQPDLVHAFDTKPCVWARLAAKVARVPIVVGTLPGLGSLYAVDKWQRRMARVPYRLLQALASHVSDLTIFQNEDDAGECIASRIVPKDKAAVIPGSGVRTDLLDPGKISLARRSGLKIELGIEGDELVVIMISRIIRSKGVSEFARAAEVVQRRYPQVRFLLAGEVDNESLDRLSAKELGELKQTINWIGKREDIPLLLALADIFVLPSSYREGIPRVLLEAASMGLPIVTSDIRGCNDVVRDGVNGFLIRPGDVMALSEAISRLVERPELRQCFGEASRRCAVERYDLSVVGEQTDGLYLRLLERRALLSPVRR